MAIWSMAIPIVVASAPIATLWVCGNRYLWQCRVCCNSYVYNTHGCYLYYVLQHSIVLQQHSIVLQ